MKIIYFSMQHTLNIIHCMIPTELIYFFQKGRQKCTQNILGQFMFWPYCRQIIIIRKHNLPLVRKLGWFRPFSANKLFFCFALNLLHWESTFLLCFVLFTSLSFLDFLLILTIWDNSRLNSERFILTICFLNMVAFS